jgi:hypothetical protein
MSVESLTDMLRMTAEGKNRRRKSCFEGVDTVKQVMAGMWGIR